MPVIVFDARGPMPRISENIWNAQRAGHPAILRYAGDGLNAARREAALRGVPMVSGLSRDEYPFASTVEGGGGAFVGHVPPGEQDVQRDYLNWFYYAALQYTPRKQFYVLVIGLPFGNPVIGP